MALAAPLDRTFPFKALRSPPRAIHWLDHGAVMSVWIVTFSGFFASLELVSRGILVAMASAYLLLFLALKFARLNTKFPFFVFVAILLIFPVATFYHGGIIPQPNYFIGPLLGIAASLSIRSVLKIHVLAMLFVQAIIQLYEWRTGQFLFYAIGKYDGILYDEEVFAGSAGVFRSKGFFDASTILGATLIFVSAIFRDSKPIIVLSIFCCLIGYARLGLLMSASIFMINFIFLSKNWKNSLYVFLYVGLLVLLIWIFVSYFVSRDFNLEYLVSALDTRSSHNIDRADFWAYGTNFFMTLDFGELFLGANERFISEVSESVENAWMNILYLCGIIIAGIYIAALFRSQDKSMEAILIRLIIFAAGMIAATFQSLATCMWFWITAMCLYNYPLNRSADSHLSKTTAAGAGG